MKRAMMIAALVAALAWTPAAMAGPPPPNEYGQNGDEHVDFPSQPVGSGYADPTMQVAPVGDVNGDGHDDVATGFHYTASPCGSCIHVIPTAPDTLAPLQIGGLPLPRGFTIHVPGLWYGITDMGDVNGDGRDDIAVTSTDKVHVVFGRTAGDVDVAQLGTNGFTIDGIWHGVASGSNSSMDNTSMTSVGDQNGDGVRDLAVRDGDLVRIIYTPSSPAGKTVDANDLDQGGYTLDPVSSNYHGTFVAGIGDVDGDGREDIGVGSDDEDDGVVQIFGVVAPGPGADVDLFEAVDDDKAFLLWADGGKRVNTMFSAGDQNRDGRRDLGFVIGGGPAGRRLHVAFSPALGTAADIDSLGADGGYSLTPYGDQVVNVGDQSGDGIDDLAVSSRVIFTDAKARANPVDLVFTNGFNLSPLNRHYPAVVGAVSDRDGDSRSEIVVAAVDARGDRFAAHDTDYAYDVFYSGSPRPGQRGGSAGVTPLSGEKVELEGSLSFDEDIGDGWQMVAELWDPATDRAFLHGGAPATRTADGKALKGSVIIDARTALGGAAMTPRAPYWARFGLRRGGDVLWGFWFGPWDYAAIPGSLPHAPFTGTAPVLPPRQASGPSKMVGTNRADRLIGSAQRDDIAGRGGNDWIDGLPEADVIDGGTGNDTVFGRTGNDRVRGGTGADKLAGEAGSDRLTGDKGRDRISGGAGNDTISARDKEKDVIDCGAGRDTVTADTKDKVAKNCEKVRRR